MCGDSYEAGRLFDLVTGALTLIQHRLDKLESKLQSSARGGSDAKKYHAQAFIEVSQKV